jgi:putative hemolysin
VNSTESTSADNRIDVEQLIRQKKPGIYRILPAFIIRYIKRVIHQDDLNFILSEQEDLDGLEFINGALDIMQISHSAEGQENIPDKGRFIFVANHPLGGLDGMVFIREVEKKFTDLKFPVNDLLFNIQNLRSIFLPINKLGGQARESVQQIDDAYRSDSQILYFPAGLCSRKISGKIIDLEWKKHFISKAIQHKRDIIPVYFSGRNSDFFYNLANIRKFFRIKINIEMFYLFDEMFMQKDKRIKMVFGKPISYMIFDKSLSHQEWANRVKEIVYTLGNENQTHSDLQR